MVVTGQAELLERWLAHWMRAAASRTFCTAGSTSPISTAMMPMTTSSSMSV
jgi:hypothetical protein